MEEIAYIKGISSEGETLLYYVSPFAVSRIFIVKNFRMWQPPPLRDLLIA